MSPRFDRNEDDEPDFSGSNIVPRVGPLEIVEPRCSVCKSKYRRSIDQLMTMGVPFAELARNFEEEGISRRSLSNHKDRHMSVTDKAVRLIIEEQVRAMGEDVENTKRHILTRQAAVDVAIMKGYNGIVTGDVAIEARDWIQMIGLREKMAEQTASVQMEEMMREFNAFAQAVKDIAPEEIWEQIQERFEYLLQQDKRIIDSYGMELAPGQDLSLPSLENPLKKPIEPDDGQ